GRVPLAGRELALGCVLDGPLQRRAAPEELQEAGGTQAVVADIGRHHIRVGRQLVRVAPPTRRPRRGLTRLRLQAAAHRNPPPSPNDQRSAAAWAWCALSPEPLYAPAGCCSALLGITLAVL